MHHLAGITDVPKVKREKRSHDKEVAVPKLDMAIKL